MHIETQNIKEIHFKSDCKIIDEDENGTPLPGSVENEGLDTDQEDDFDIFGVSMD